MQRDSAMNPLSFTLLPVDRFGSILDFSQRQISDSLQRLRSWESDAGIPADDPYRSSPESQAPNLSAVIHFRINTQPACCEHAFGREIEVNATNAFLATHKTLASFIGRVECISIDTAHVLLTNEKTGECLESQCDPEMLHENGIGAGDEFRCEILRHKGTTATRFFRLPPKKLSKERVEQIRGSFSERWQF